MQPFLDTGSLAASVELARYAAYWDLRIAMSMAGLAAIVLTTVVLVRLLCVNPLVRELRAVGARLPR